MSKLRLSLIVIAITCAATTVAFGELFSFKASPQSSTATSSHPGTTPPLSPSDFQAQVNIKAQQAQAQALQQQMSNAKNQLSQIPPPAPSKSISATPPSTTTPPPASTTAPSTDTGTTSDVSTVPPAPTTTPTTATPAPIAPGTGATVAPAAPSTPSSQPYTGFQGGSTNSSTNQSGSGWNIKY